MYHDYQVVGLETELPCGSRFVTISEFPLQPGSLALFSIGEIPHERLIVGRWVPDVAGCDWIWQPERWIRIARNIIIKFIGLIVPIYFDYFDVLIWSSILACSTGMTLIEVWNTLAPTTLI